MEANHFLPIPRVLGRDIDLSVSELEVLPLLDKELLPTVL